MLNCKEKQKSKGLQEVIHTLNERLTDLYSFACQLKKVGTLQGGTDKGIPCRVPIPSTEGAGPLRCTDWMTGMDLSRSSTGNITRICLTSTRGDSERCRSSSMAIFTWLLLTTEWGQSSRGMEVRSLLGASSANSKCSSRYYGNAF